MTTKYKIRKYKPEEYEILCEWALQRNFPLSMPEQLPPTGLIGYIDDIPVAACFLYKTDAEAAFLAGLISNPDYDKQERKKLGDILMSRLVKTGKEEGWQVFCWTVLEKMKSRLTDIGFKKTEENATFYGI